MHETFSKQIMKTRKEFYAQSLTFIRLYYTIIKLQKSKNVPVAQLDRVFDYESKGRGFESLLAHQKVILRMKCVEWLFIMSGIRTHGGSCKHERNATGEISVLAQQ